MKTKQNGILFWIGIVTAIWFALAGMVWAYWACLIIAYPVGLISYFIWRSIKSDNKQRNKFIPAILLIGLALSISVLIYLLIFG